MCSITYLNRDKKKARRYTLETIWRPSAGPDPGDAKTNRKFLWSVNTYAQPHWFHPGWGEFTQQYSKIALYFYRRSLNFLDPLSDIAAVIAFPATVDPVIECNSLLDRRKRHYLPVHLRPFHHPYGAYFPTVLLQTLSASVWFPWSYFESHSPRKAFRKAQVDSTYH